MNSSRSSVHKNIGHGVQRGLAAHADAAALPGAVQRAAPGTGLIGHQCIPTQRVRPVGHDVAVAGAADRILRHIALGGEAAGDAVVSAAARRGDMQQQAVQRPHLLLIHGHMAHRVLVIKDAQEVAAHVGRLGHRAIHGLRHGRRHRHRRQLVGREIHFVQVAPAHHGQLAGQGVERDDGAVRGHMVHNGTGGGQRGVTAQVDLAAGGEPAQPVVRSLRNGKGRFGQVVLTGDGHHLRLGGPAVHDADGGGVAGKDLVRKGIYDVLSHICRSFPRRLWQPV